MYKLLHKLFGWDYIHWQNTADEGVARVRKLPDGRVVYWRYRFVSVMDDIKEAKQVRWLTCKPSKYLNEPILKNEEKYLITYIRGFIEIDTPQHRWHGSKVVTIPKGKDINEVVDELRRESQDSAYRYFELKNIVKID